MNTQLLLVFAILTAAGGFVLLVWILARQRAESSRVLQDMARQIIEAQKQDQSAQFLQREVASLREQMTKSLAESARLVSDANKTVGERLDKAAEVVGTVQRSLGSLEKATQQVFDVGKDIAELQEILRAPKTRGAIGEMFLGDLLGQILPPKNFTLQHTFRSRETVDAVVRLGRLVPVDAKFPLENFKRLLQYQNPTEKAAARRRFIADVKKHIDAIATKYILPDEGTYDFALMYIPTENVYYETIIKEDASSDEGSLMTYAFSKHVVPVSPNSFYAYLHTISLGLRGLQIEENARHLIDQLSRLRGDFLRFKDDFSLVGKHLANARGKFEDSEKRLVRFEDKLIATGEAPEELPVSTAGGTSELPL